MIFERFIDIDLGQVSYIIACSITKEACIIDPRRDIDEYTDYIEKNTLELKYILNSHTHADYIGGHMELATKYAAKNIFQKSAPIENYVVKKVQDGDVLLLGESLCINVLETPGHTPFDLCFLVQENNSEKFLFTGDILFIGDMGRPDLLGEENLQYLAEQSFDSANRLWSLEDSLLVFTSHIEGSLCGKNLNQQYFSTIGIEKQTNRSFYLSQESKQKYIDNLLKQKLETPAFFKKMAGLNIEGPKLIRNILDNMIQTNFEKISLKSNIQIVDIRKPDEFHKKHIQGSINIYEHSNVSLIAGNLLDYDRKIYIIGQSENLDKFIIKLLRVGLDNIEGILQDDLSSLNDDLCFSSNVVGKDAIDNSFTNVLLDCECSSFGTLVQSDFSSLKELNIDQFEKVVFSCKQGYKSSAAISLFEADKVYYVSE